MSTKTIKQRIAVVAATALTAGFLSVVSAPVANAAALDLQDPTTAGNSTNIITARAGTGLTQTATMYTGGTLGFDLVAGGAGVVGIVTITGGTFTDTGTSAGKTATTTQITTAANVGIVDAIATPATGAAQMIITSYTTAVSDANKQDVITVTLNDELLTGVTSGVAHISGSICGVTNLVGTAPLSGRAGLSSDVSPFESGSAAGRIITVPVGALLNVQYDTSDVFTISGPLSIQSLTTSQTSVATITNGKVVVTGNATDGTFTLTAGSVGTATIVVDPTVADQTPTAANTIRVTIVSSCSASGFVAAASFVSVEATSVIATDNVDASASKADTQQGFLSIVGKNAYGTVLPSGTWIASATNGARVDIADGGAAAASTTGPSSDAVPALGTDIRVAVAQATEGVAMTSVVTVTYNGTVVATKSFSWTGDLASITVTSIALGKTAAANYNSLTVRTFDAAGTQIDWAGTSLTLEGFDQNVTTGDVVDTKKVSSESSSTNDGHFFTCGSSAKSKTKLKVKGIAGSLAAVYSPEFEVSCSTETRTYAAALDKTSYVPGDIATLTITAKDINGNAPFDPTSTAADNTNDTFNYVNAGVAGTAQAIGYSNLTPVVAPAAADYFVGGVKTYQFVVGATEGDYQLTLGITGLTSDTEKTVKYSIKSETTTVSFAEVLKSIVALIASINKQIQALQKLILKR